MHIVQLKIDNSIYSNVMFLLNNLNLKGLHINETKEVTKKTNSLDFSKYKVDAFKDMEDPVKWQQSIRDEWA